MIANKDGKKKLHKTKGKTLKLRFVVERLVTELSHLIQRNIYPRNTVL